MKDIISRSSLSFSRLAVVLTLGIAVLGNFHSKATTLSSPPVSQVVYVHQYVISVVPTYYEFHHPNREFYPRPQNEKLPRMLVMVHTCKAYKARSNC